LTIPVGAATPAVHATTILLLQHVAQECHEKERTDWNWYNQRMVIVDGNNVMGQRVGWHRNKAAAQRQLIDEVERFARSRNEPHILVFDSKPKQGIPGEESRPMLIIQFAARGASADELILELVYRHCADSEVSVVTSDRALALQSRVLGAKVMPSGVFRRKL